MKTIQGTHKTKLFSIHTKQQENYSGYTKRNYFCCCCDDAMIRMARKPAECARERKQSNENREEKRTVFFLPIAFCDEITRRRLWVIG